MTSQAFFLEMHSLAIYLGFQREENASDLRATLDCPHWIATLEAKQRRGAVFANDFSVSNGKSDFLQVAQL